jgi:long-chain acyl-CoA synthetase
MYTSGTTGYPKGALLTHKNLTTASYMGVIAMQINGDGRSLIVAPLFHVAASVFALTTMLVGGTNVLMDQFDPLEVLLCFEREKISHSFFAPAMLKMLLQVPGVEGYNYSSLRTLCFGGAPMTYNLFLECRRVFQCDFLQGFGQTEATTFVATMSQEEYRHIAEHPETQHKLTAVGKDFPGVRIRIVDDHDRDVPRGEVGEIIAQGDNVMIGYYKMPEATEETLRGGWLHTGDLGKFDQERYLYLVDRKKDLIISGGENIYSPEIEQVLLQLAGVMEVAVVGIPHEKWGEVPKAFVVQNPKAGLSETQIIEFCKKNLAGYKCPKAVEFLQALPRNAAGKVLKRNLRERQA